MLLSADRHCAIRGGQDYGIPASAIASCVGPRRRVSARKRLWPAVIRNYDASFCAVAIAATVTTIKASVVSSHRRRASSASAASSSADLGEAGRHEKVARS
jgi:hypothetical protein